MSSPSSAPLLLDQIRAYQANYFDVAVLLEDSQLKAEAFHEAELAHKEYEEVYHIYKTFLCCDYIITIA